MLILYVITIANKHRSFIPIQSNKVIAKIRLYAIVRALLMCFIKKVKMMKAGLKEALNVVCASVVLDNDSVTINCTKAEFLDLLYELANEEHAEELLIETTYYYYQQLYLGKVIERL